MLNKHDRTLNNKLEPDGTEVELASTFMVIVLRTAKIESHNNSLTIIIKAAQLFCLF